MYAPRKAQIRSVNAQLSESRDRDSHNCERPGYWFLVVEIEAIEETVSIF